MPAIVFLTGSTGFVGTQIARNLISHTDSQIVAVVRGENKETATLRLMKAWWEWPELYPLIGNRIKVVNGDLSKPNFNLEKTAYVNLVENTTHIIHAAADTTPNLSIQELQKINVTGTANVIELAKDIEKNHGLARLSHISTAYVAGKREGEIYENDLLNQPGFSSNYEETKYESEVLINNAKELPASIFRPSLVIGDSKTGAIKTFNTIYYLLKLYLAGQLRIMPTSPKFRINVVPVDYVADSVVKLTFDDHAKGLTFHLTAPWEKTPTADELVNFVRGWAKEKMNLNLPKVLFTPGTEGLTQKWLQLQGSFSPSAKGNSNAFKILAPYFGSTQKFNRQNTDRLLPDYNFNWRDFLPNILQYAVHYTFFHRSDRTVHEQILFRLQSTTKPIKYHEITAQGTINYETEEVRKEILSTAAAMKAMGVKKGDTIVIIGYNSLRYLMVDVAAGLLGAVSSPIYYTTPIAKVDKILVETKAKLFFVGIPKLLQDIESITTDIPIISFCSNSSNTYFSEKVMSWSKFLEHQTSNLPSFAPVGFQDLATIRYTYGSTGEPKGACLDHGNLRFVAESLASLFPWRARNTKASYLSFLPMNHVAEGITAAYAPYFVPASLDIYFLEDYHNLQKALPKAKPTVFFTIPRFYEKLWGNIESNPLGRAYIKTQNGLKKQFLRKILRYSVLRKSGLNHCQHFIVGAACSSPTLLTNLHELGIEVHNAYGLSEAPLVTMNKIGSNSLDTVGPPLPNTELRIDSDGEILIKGPQVMRGYLNPDEQQSLENGWFASGDIGELTSEGNLKIHGRKKNIIVTSYGKKIPIDKIEASLKIIECVKEAIVIGDNQPFCSAVFWVDKQKQNYQAQIDFGIEQLNKELEDPAKIKRYVVLDESSLGKENAESSLKTKRQECLKQIQPLIETIYA